MNSARTSITGCDDDGIARVQGLLDALAGANRLPPDPVTDMQVALDEVLSNTLRNGFSDDLPHRVDVTLSVDSQTLTAEIEDDCAPFDPLSVPAPDLRGSLHERRVGGLGIHFVRALMSEVNYARVHGRNRLVLRKNLVDLAEGS
ncbi:MAG TPA: ATP-binding protein [Steroidobacteraceae bacterium]|nr:ATP-binding protein [Steroidobacteraceae bacterium]